MSLKTFQVVFDRENATYAAGETVTGKIVLETTHAKTVRGMHATVKGVCNILWRDDEDSAPIFANSETYLDERFDIIGSQIIDTRTEITAGYHEYRFSYQLPYRIPSSYKDRFSKIEYTVKVIINRPWKYNHEHESPFTVISSLDLKDYSALCLAIDDEDRVTFYRFCCFCEQGSLALRIRIPTAGYIPGQCIYTTVDYNNLSKGVRITKISAKLYRKVKYYATIPGPKEKEHTSLVKSTKLFSPFPKVGQNVLELLIPPIPPSYLEHCHIVDLEYKLDINIHVSGMHWEIKKSYPILIGTTLTSPIGQNPPVSMPMSTQMPIPTPISSAPYPLPEAQPHNESSSDQPLPAPSNTQSTHENVTQDGSSYVGANAPFAPRLVYPPPKMFAS